MILKLLIFSYTLINCNIYNLTSKVKYLGELRTQSTHVASNNSIITDAPIDNHGKGEAFSPTDTVATALASCLLTIMGIKAKQFKIDIRGTIAEVKKIMGENPRRIDSIIINIHFKKNFDIKIYENKSGK